jgi:hypothetical protein
MLDSMFKKFAETSFGTIVLNLFVSCNGDKSCKNVARRIPPIGGNLLFSQQRKRRTSET